MHSPFGAYRQLPYLPPSVQTQLSQAKLLQNRPCAKELTESSNIKTTAISKNIATEIPMTASNAVILKKANSLTRKI